MSTVWPTTGSSRCFVVKDAVSGVTAAQAGGMAALGIARLDDTQLLTHAGADLVVTTLDDPDRGSLRDGCLARVAPVVANAPNPREPRPIRRGPDART